MRFGERIRELRKKNGWRLRDLAERVGVGHTHLSRVENERLNYGDYPSDDLIHRISMALEADEDELRVLAKRIPEPIRQRVIERPDAFLVFAACDDKMLDQLLLQINQMQQTYGKKPNSGQKATQNQDLKKEFGALQ